MANKPLESLDLEHLIKNVVNDRLMMQLGQLAIEAIKKRTQLGYGVPELGKAQQKLAPLAPQTVKNRKLAKNQGQLSPKTTPKKSNLTETGLLLDSIKFIGTKAGQIEIYIAGERNRQIATYAAEKRPFFTLSKSEVSRLADVIQQALSTYLKRN